MQQLASMSEWLRQPKNKKHNQERNHKYELWQDIRKAQAEWQFAQDRLDYVVDHDQIDYAIFALEAAEKRYSMLLKAAKKVKLSLVDSDRLLEVGL